jgi:FAD-dependent halogenase
MNQYDVIVVGGGPAGSTAGALLAKRGHRVLLLEREKFPRYHIGESLVPGMLPILRELGLADRAEKYGYVQKNGITLVWGRNHEPWTVHFGEAGPFEHAYQVCRAEFDNMLLQNARACGVTVLEEARVRDFLFDGDRCAGVAYTQAGGDGSTEARARMVVDASGQSQLLARKMNWLEWDDQLKNIAVWAYFQGGKLYEGRNAGNILVENMGEGWLWVIPLHDGTQSVGWVTSTENVRNHESNLGGLLMEKISASHEAIKLLAPAKRASAIHTARDWSYKCTRMQGPGFLLVGDAGGFVDPLFSTGVFLAMNGASLAAQTIAGALAAPEKEAALRDRYETGYKKFLDIVFSFVHYFYDASRDKEQYWEKARTLVDPIAKMSQRQDFVYLISGLGGVHSVMGLEPDRAIVELNTTRREGVYE